MAEPLTGRQRQVYEFIVDRIDCEGFAPTMREIGDHLGISSTNGVNDHLRALERKGYITREDAKSRAIRPVIIGVCPTCGAPRHAEPEEVDDV